MVVVARFSKAVVARATGSKTVKEGHFVRPQVEGVDGRRLRGRCQVDRSSRRDQFGVNMFWRNVEGHESVLPPYGDRPEDHSRVVGPHGPVYAGLLRQRRVQPPRRLRVGRRPAGSHMLQRVGAQDHPAAAGPVAQERRPALVVDGQDLSAGGLYR